MATVKYRRDLKAMELRRRKGMRMLARGVRQAEVARELEVSRQTASNWERERLADAQAWRRRPLGRPAALDAQRKRQLAERLQRGAVACGFATELWTLQRVSALIERDFGVRFSIANVWLLLTSLGFSSQRPVGRAIQRDESAILAWKTQRWPALKKSADATAARSSSSTSRGSRERPTRVKTWAPKGCTPMLQYSFNWKQLSLIDGVTVANFYFRFFPGAIKAPQLIEYLQALARQIKGKLLIIWDGLPAHRSRLVRAHVESLGDRIVLERLPAYAPELNPVEYLFGYAKQRELANLCLHTIDEVRRYATRRLKSLQHRPRLITAFWQQAELPI